MTVKKSYDELEQEGFIKTVQGKGSYVAPQNLELIKEEQIKQIEKHIEKIVTISQYAGIGKDEIIELFDYFYGEQY